MSGLVDHYEQYLGPIVSGWSVDADGTKLPFQVVQFKKTPIEGACVLASLGLSNTPLQIKGSENWLRQELIMMFRESEGPRNLPGILQQVGLEALAKGRAYQLGDVLGPRGELRAGSKLQALYVALPVYLPDEFQVCRPTGAEPIVIAWLVPISATEAEFVRAYGASRFEDEMVNRNPDVLDFERDPIV